MLTTVKTILAADWAAAGTITVSYPTGIEGGHISSVDHKISIKNGANLLQGRDFALTTVNKTTAVLTLAAGITTIPAGSELYVEFHLKGDRYDIDPNAINTQTQPAGNRVSRRQVLEVNFGAPATAVAAGIIASQDLTALGVFSVSTTLAAALAAGPLAGVFDVPRNVVAAWTGTAVLTIIGYDEFGVLVKESSASGTSLAGKKAFKRITSVTTSANITALTVGSGDVLGFPIFLPNTVNVLYDTEDNATITDGTYVAGVVTKPTATTGDVRGTYDPNSACDGAKKFSVVLLTDDPTYLGVPQFGG